jgi:serine/threonine-protein kinase
VQLKVVRGPLTGQLHIFSERTTCLIGRASDCNLRLPDDADHRTVSRHHCLLDINPPYVRARDFGSLNGTFVNGAKIGQRRDPQSASATVVSAESPEHDLNDGDLLRIGGTELAVSIQLPAPCAGCGTEVAAPGELCSRCAAVGAEPEVVASGAGGCPVCGGPSDTDTGTAGLCASCRQNPRRVIDTLIDPELAVAGIRGYTILRLLGRGGMGSVLLAQQESDNRLVALKVMLPQMAVKDRARRMFQREIENARTLDHPNVVRLLHAGLSRGVFFCALEYCEHGSIADLLRERRGPLPVAEAVRIAVAALDALEYIHTAEVPSICLEDGSFGIGRGLVHRDIKPANLLLTGPDPPQLKVADVGLAKAFDLAGLSGQTRTGAAAGTPLYMPRQQVINFKYAQPDVDVWSLAATLYAMLTGHAPRRFPRGVDPWRIVLQEPAVPILERNPEIPHRLAGVVDHALQERPRLAYTRAKDLREALEAAL